MRSFILMSVFILPTAAIAENCKTVSSGSEIKEQLVLSTDVPSHLKGATITVRLADGTESIVPAEKFKVVPRKQQFITTKTMQRNETRCESDPKDKNRISLLAGEGPKEGLTRTQDGSAVTVESKVGAVGGAQYQRLLTEKLGVGVQVQSNKTALGVLSLDF